MFLPVLYISSKNSQCRNSTTIFILKTIIRWNLI
jgi:hypothetical protein